MLWSEFKSEVKAGIAYEADRERYGAYIEKQIRNAALDLQREVKPYREGHVSRFTSLNMEAKGNAGIVALAEGVQVEDVYLRPERAYESSTADAAVTFPFPEDLTGAVSLTLKLWVRGELQPDAMVVEGSGDIEAEGLFIRDGDLNAFPKYSKALAPLVNALFVDSNWKVGNPGFDTLYFNLQIPAPLTPDLITDAWQVADGEFPAPTTVRRATWADIDAAGIDRTIVPTRPPGVSISTDQSDTATATLEAGIWQYKEVTLSVADAASCTTINLGFDNDVAYTPADWSEATVEEANSGYSKTTFFGKTETERLYSTKKLERYPWGRRDELVAGDPGGHAPGWYANNRNSLWAYKIDQAALDAGATLEVRGHGRKLNFTDTDDTPFDETAAAAAALYVKYKLLKHIDKLNEGWKIERDYEKERSLIIADWNSR